MIALVRVTWAHERPPIPAHQHVSHVIVQADNDAEAHCVAAQIVACRNECVMPTATEIIEVDE